MLSLTGLAILCAGSRVNSKLTEASKCNLVVRYRTGQSTTVNNNCGYEDGSWTCLQVIQEEWKCSLYYGHIAIWKPISLPS